MTAKYEVVKIGQVIADENQPRKYFSSTKLHQLMKSIEKEGIISPLLVEEVGGNYMLIDGERRFRAAQELGLKEVPVIIEPPTNLIERLTRQFTVQEQHEEWTAAEKAEALIKLSEEIGVSVFQVCKLLNVEPGVTDRYVAFSQIIDRATWVRNEMPLEFAVKLRSLRNSVARLYEFELKKEFTRSEEKRLEKRIIQGIKDGAIVRPNDFMRLRDAFTKNAKMIEVYLNDLKETPVSLYLKVEARGATSLRNAVINASYVRRHADIFLQTRDTKVSEEQLKILKIAKASIDALIDTAE